MTDTGKPVRPSPDEYDPFYETYVAAVPNVDIMVFLNQQLETAVELLESVPEERLDYRYATGKWTTREVVGHVVDCERLFSYRAFRFARGDSTPLAGLDQDAIMAGADFSSRSMGSLINEFRHLRASNISLFMSLSPECFDRRGIASGCEFTVRALMYILAGHAEHHMQVIGERYLS